ncbi:MAG: hypothetical protein KAH21_06045, partial [Spirochaetaceae bacterium]|nr:hypothetical protein [Spirochaetaceae bacterium]
IIGHRGAPERAIENTESSFRAALEAGASIIETDVRLCADGAIVISHDRDFARFGGPSKAISRSRKSDLEKIELKDAEGRIEKPFFLDDALRKFPDSRFSIDLKDSGSDIVRAWSDLMKSSCSGNRCRTASFRDRTLRLFRHENPGAQVSIARLSVAWLLLSTLFGYPKKPGSGEGVLQLPEFYGPLRILSHRRILRWQKIGWKVQVWTVDEEVDMRRFVRWGIDGIITNKPFLLKNILVSLEIQGS